MNQKRSSLIVLFSLLIIAGVSALLESCQPSCDSIPTEALAQVRILNAVSNASVLVIYIDGKVFDSAWYDVHNPYYSMHYPGGIFGDRSTFVSDGSPLRAGLHRVTAKVRSGPFDSLSTLVDTSLLLQGSRESLIFIGKVGGAASQTPRVLYLNDVLREPATASFARFVHAVPDINGARDTGGLDVYFSDTVRTIRGVPLPDLRIRFGHISHQNPDGSTNDDGTGLSADDYVQFPPQVPGLLILPVGDTNINHAIVSLPYNLGTSGILATIVIRGEANPVGREPVASALVLEDGLLSKNTASYETNTFGVRTVNAVRFDSLTLLISSSNDQTPGTPRSLDNAPFSGQIKVSNILPDSVSPYMALSPAPAWYDFWFGPTGQGSQVAFGFTTNQSDNSLAHIPPIGANQRYTFVAMDTIAHNSGKQGIALLELPDTVASPVDPAMGRVRLVNTTADYTASFTLGGTPFTMKQRNVRYVDLPIGAHSFSVPDGTSTAMVNFNLSNEAPITIFFLPTNAQHTIPYTISTP